MSFPKTFFLFLGFVLLSCAIAGQSRPPDLRDMEKKYKNGTVHGMKITILLRGIDSQQRGTLSPVDPQRDFKQGDAVRIEAESNFNGFLYMINIGASGRTRVLFPDGVEQNQIPAGRRLILPASYDLEFDGTKGTDIFRVLLSLQPVSFLDQAIKNRDGELSQQEMQWLNELSSKADPKKVGIIGSDFLLNNIGRGVTIRKPIWNEQSKKSLVIFQRPKAKKKISTPTLLQPSEIGIFGIQFRNLGAASAASAR